MIASKRKESNKYVRPPPRPVLFAILAAGHSLSRCPCRNGTPTTAGSLIVNHVEPECGGYTGLAIQHDSSTGRPLLYASTITGGLYAFRLEGPAEGGPADDRWGGKLPSEGEEGRLRCVGFVRGSPIL